MKRNMMIASAMVLFLGLAFFASPQCANAKPHKDIDKLQGYWTESNSFTNVPQIIVFSKDGEEMTVSGYSPTIDIEGASEYVSINFIDKDHFIKSNISYERIDINDEKYQKLYQKYGNCLRFEESCTKLQLARKGLESF